MATLLYATPGHAAPDKPASSDILKNSLLDWAGGTSEINLQHVVEQALRAAPELRQAQINVEISQAGVDGAQSLTSFFVNAQSANEATLIGSDPNYDSSSNSVTLGKSLATGGTVTATASSTRSRTDGATRWATGLSLVLTHPLLQGAGREVHLGPARRAELAHEAARLAIASSAQTLILQVLNAYWALVQAEQELAILKQSVTVLLERQKRLAATIRTGKVPAVEMVAIEQSLNSRYEDVFSAEANLVTRSVALRRLINLPLGAGSMLLQTNASIDLPEETAWDVDALTQAALGFAPELAQLALTEDGNNLEIRLAENGMLPSLDATLSVGTGGFSNKFVDAWSNFAGFKAFSFGGTLEFGWEPGRAAQKATLQRARLTRQASVVSGELIRNQIREAVVAATLTLELAARRVKLAQNATALGDKAVQAEQARFDLGQATSFDIVARQDERRQADLRLARAKIDWHIAQNRLLALTGQLLPALGVKVTPLREGSPTTVPVFDGLGVTRAVPASTAPTSTTPATPAADQ